MHLKKELIDMMINDFPSLKIKGNHNNWILKCPFHHDIKERPQFFIDVKYNNYHCIGCGIRGKVDNLESDLERFEKKFGSQVKLEINKFNEGN